MNELCLPHLVALVALTADDLVEVALKQLYAYGYTDLRRHHFLHVSRWLQPAGVRPSELAARAGISRPSMSELVNELEQLGYVTRVPDPTDSRARLVVPAQRSIEADAILQAYWGQLEEKLQEKFGSKQVKQTTDLLSSFREALI